MEKFLLALFLIAFNCKVRPDLSDLYNRGHLSEQALWLEKAENAEKDKGERSQPDLNLVFCFNYQEPLPILQIPHVSKASFAYRKPSAGFVNQVYTPPNLILHTCDAFDTSNLLQQG